MTKRQRRKKATNSMIHRIAQAKKKYGADNTKSYMEASKRIKEESK